MLLPNEHKSSSAKVIQKLADEISTNMHHKLECFKKRINEIRESQVLQVRHSQQEIAKLSKLLEELRTKNLAQINKREQFTGVISADEEDLARVETENKGLLGQVKDLLSTNRKLAEKKLEGEHRLSGLLSRLHALKTKHSGKLEAQKRVNQEFRKFLGIDIIRIKDKTLKIIFGNLPADSYVIIDFNKANCVDECVPDMNLEKLNFMFKEGNDFYKFIRFVQLEMKRKL